MAKLGTPEKDKGGKSGDRTPSVIPSNLVVEPKCKVCNSPHRREIDMMLATGWSQAAVRRHVNNMMGEEFFSHVNISVHARKHLTTQDAAVRKIIETRARQEGIDIEGVTDYIVTKTAVLDLIIQSGIQGLNRGHTITEPREMIAAIQTLDKMEAEWKESAIDEMLREFRAFSDAVKSVVPPEQFAEIYAKFEETIDGQDHVLRKMPLADIEVKEIEEAQYEEVSE